MQAEGVRETGNQDGPHELHQIYGGEICWVEFDRLGRRQNCSSGCLFEYQGLSRQDIWHGSRLCHKAMPRLLSGAQTHDVPKGRRCRVRRTSHQLLSIPDRLLCSPHPNLLQLLHVALKVLPSASLPGRNPIFQDASVVLAG